MPTPFVHSLDGTVGVQISVATTGCDFMGPTGTNAAGTYVAGALSCNPPQTNHARLTASRWWRNTVAGTPSRAWGLLVFNALTKPTVDVQMWMWVFNGRNNVRAGWGMQTTGELYLLGGTAPNGTRVTTTRNYGDNKDWCVRHLYDRTAATQHLWVYRPTGKLVEHILASITNTTADVDNVYWGITNSADNVTWTCDFANAQGSLDTMPFWKPQLDRVRTLITGPDKMQVVAQIQGGNAARLRVTDNPTTSTLALSPTLTPEQDGYVKFEIDKLPSPATAYNMIFELRDNTGVYATVGSPYPATTNPRLGSPNVVTIADFTCLHNEEASGLAFTQVAARYPGLSLAINKGDLNYSNPGTLAKDDLTPWQWGRSWQEQEELVLPLRDLAAVNFVSSPDDHDIGVANNQYNHPNIDRAFAALKQYMTTPPEPPDMPTTGTSYGSIQIGETLVVLTQFTSNYRSDPNATDVPWSPGDPRPVKTPFGTAQDDWLERLFTATGDGAYDGAGGYTNYVLCLNKGWGGSAASASAPTANKTFTWDSGTHGATIPNSTGDYTALSGPTYTNQARHGAMAAECVNAAFSSTYANLGLVDQGPGQIDFYFKIMSPTANTQLFEFRDSSTARFPFIARGSDKKFVITDATGTPTGTASVGTWVTNTWYRATVRWPAKTNPFTFTVRLYLANPDGAAYEDITGTVTTALGITNLEYGAYSGWAVIDTVRAYSDVSNWPISFTAGAGFGGKTDHHAKYPAHRAWLANLIKDRRVLIVTGDNHYAGITNADPYTGLPLLAMAATNVKSDNTSWDPEVTQTYPVPPDAHDVPLQFAGIIKVSRSGTNITMRGTAYDALADVERFFCERTWSAVPQVDAQGVRAIPFPDGTPSPYVEIDISNIDLVLGGDTLTVFRQAAGGPRQEVRGAAGIDIPGSTYFVLDYEAPFNIPLTYSVSIYAADGTLLEDQPANPVTLAVDDSWISDPLRPTLATKVNISEWQERTYSQDQAVLPVSGRKRPVVLIDTRHALTSDLVLATRTPDERNDLRTLLQSTNPVLLRPADPEWDQDAVYLSTADVTERRVSIAPMPHRFFDMAVTEVDSPPADIIAPVYTWADVMTSWSTWALVKAARDTWLDVLKDPISA